MSKPLKILVCGDVEGRFSQLYSRVNSIQKKAGAFDLLLCVGDFFGDDKSCWETYKSTNIKAPICTLILGPNQDSHKTYYGEQDGSELHENITYLGRRGIYVASNGLKVAYLSGVDDMTATDSTSGPVTFSPDDLASLVASMSDRKYAGVDILLTSPWPRGVEKYAIKPEGVTTELGSPAIAQLARLLKPRYHFSAMGSVFYERLPYRNHKVLQEDARHSTRFIGLAKVGNPKKLKFLYAFNMLPMNHMDATELIKQPPDVTECPFSKEASFTDTKKEKSAQFFYDQDKIDKNDVRSGSKRKPKSDHQGGAARKQPKPTGPCWFCLGSPEVEKHLVVSVGTQCYLALAKGGLTDDHILILPIGHHQSTISSPTDILQEIDKYKSALRRFFKSQDKSVVFFERNYKTQHMQIQAVPVPNTVRDELKETFQGCALCQNIELHEIPKLSDLKQIVPEGAPYFYTELPSGDRLLYRITKGFPLNFGREVVADNTILNLPDRVDWRNCKLSKQEETAIAKTFRSNFEKYDFNIE